MSALIQLGVLVYERGAAGVPSSSYLTSLQGRLESYQHTSAATIGFESMACTFTGTVEEALDWLNGLMRSVIVYGPDAEIVWEGYLTTVDVQFGQERRSVSLDGMANRIRVRYTTVLGTPGTTSTASDTSSHALYGVKDLVLSLNDSTSTDATQLRTAALATYKNPTASPASEIKTGDIGNVSITLTFAGWYTTLEWVLTSDTSTTNTSTTTQVGSLLSDIASTNAFISTSTANITASGNSATEFIAPDTSYREKIEFLLNQGTSGNQRQAWGVYEDRKFRVNTWAGATPTTVTYQRNLGNGQVYDTNGGLVLPWNVRPDAMYQVIELLDIAPVSTAQDAAARFYVERVTCTIQGDSVGVSLEPTTFTSVDAMIARLGG